MLPPEFFQDDFHALPDILAIHAGERPDHIAVIQGERRLSYAALTG